MNTDKNKEFDAFKTVHDALEPLDDDARSRIVNSVVMLLAIDAHAGSSADADDTADEEVTSAEAANDIAGADRFSSFAELVAVANPTTNSDRALVAGYWIQVCIGGDSFTAQAANKELTHLGHKIANITAAIDPMRSAKPQLVLQLKKSGSSRQARKTYKLSDAGLKRVHEMIG